MYFEELFNYVLKQHFIRTVAVKFKNKKKSTKPFNKFSTNNSNQRNAPDWPMGCGFWKHS